MLSYSAQSMVPRGKMYQSPVKVLVGGDDTEYTNMIVGVLARELNTKSVKYDFTSSHNPPAANLGERWIVAGCPARASEYRKICRDGYSPDFVFCVGARFSISSIESVTTFYEGIVSSFVGDASWVVNEIKKVINTELTARDGF